MQPRKRGCAGDTVFVRTERPPGHPPGTYQAVQALERRIRRRKALILCFVVVSHKVMLLLIIIYEDPFAQ